MIELGTRGRRSRCPPSLSPAEGKGGHEHLEAHRPLRSGPRDLQPDPIDALKSTDEKMNRYAFLLVQQGRPLVPADAPVARERRSWHPLVGSERTGEEGVSDGVCFGTMEA
jgi:hypothetical protein